MVFFVRLEVDLVCCIRVWGGRKVNKMVIFDFDVNNKEVDI